MKRSSVRLSVRPPICLSHRSTAATTLTGMLLSARRQEISIVCMRRCSAATPLCTALGSKCGQRHVDSRRRKMKRGLFTTIGYFAHYSCTISLHAIVNFTNLLIVALLTTSSVSLVLYSHLITKLYLVWRISVILAIS